MLNPRQKKRLENLFTGSGVILDEGGWNSLRRLLDGWSAIRPITLMRDQSGDGFELRWIEEHREKKANQEEGNEEFPTLHQYVLRMDHSGANMKLIKKTDTAPASLTDFSNKKAHTYEGQDAKISSFVDLRYCSERIYSLCDTIINSLVMGGDLTSSSINTHDHMERFKKALNNILAKSEKERRIQALRKMTQLLDPAQLQIMRASRLDNLKTLQWLNNSGNAIQDKYRLQAAQSYPLFLPVMAGHNFLERSTNDMALHHMSVSANRETWKKNVARRDASIKIFRDLNDAIINAAPFSGLVGQALSSDFTVSEKTIRNLGRIKSLPKMSYTDFLRATQHLDQMDHTWHPKTPEDLKNYITCVKCADAFKIISRTPVIDTLKNTEGKWAKWAAKFGSAQDILDIKDWLDEVHTIAILPAVLQHSPLEAVQTLLKGGINRYPEFAQHADRMLQDLVNRGLALPSPIAREEKLMSELLAGVSDMELLACSKRWHEQGEGYAARKCTLGFTGLKDIQQWQALSAPVVSPQGILMTPLSSREELNIEGREASHCVGWNGYSEKCLTGRDHIVSLSQDGKKLSTLQLREVFNASGHVTSLKNVQHQGVKRIAITDLEERAVKWYIRELFNNQSLMPDWENLENERKTNRLTEAKSGVAGIIGFDVMEDGNCNAAYEAIRSYLPNRYRNMTYDSFVAAPHLAELFKFENTQLYKTLLDKELIKRTPQKKIATAPQADNKPQANDNKQSFLSRLRQALG